jgi:DNA modification methylase
MGQPDLITDLEDKNMNYTLHQGDCIATLQTLPEKSINCCVTSPPYFGLRDYGHDGQIGLEQTPEAYVNKMVEVFREVRRVLRDDGTLWLNLGDSYNNRSCARKSSHQTGLGFDSEDLRKTWKDLAGEGRTRMSFTHGGMKEKDLMGIPWRVAFALQADGWYLRQDIIWHKPNPMPESVKDRCTKAHEYIFLLSKSERYYFDSEAMKEPAVSEKPAGNKRHKYADAYANGTGEEHRTKAGLLALQGVEWETRNRRSVWTVATKPYKGAHFATYPPELIRPCILAGCPKGGTVLDPFGGSGTTAQVAIEEGRNAILCELNPEYIELAKRRIEAAHKNYVENLL